VLDAGIVDGDVDVAKPALTQLDISRTSGGLLMSAGE
jgi:hypothetical protein